MDKGEKMKYLKWFIIYVLYVTMGICLLHYYNLPMEGLVIIYGSLIIANQETK